MDRRSFLKIGALAGMGSMLNRSTVATALADITQPALPMFGPGAVTAVDTQHALEMVWQGTQNTGAMASHAREWSELIEGEAMGIPSLAGKNTVMAGMQATEGAAAFAQSEMAYMQSAAHYLQVNKAQVLEFIGKGQVAIPAGMFGPDGLALDMQQYYAESAIDMLTPQQLQWQSATSQQLISGARQNILKIAQQKYDMDIEDTHAPTFQESFAARMKALGAYAIINPTREQQGQGPNQIVVEAVDKPEAEIRAGLEALRSMLCERMPEAVQGATFLTNRRLMLRLDYGADRTKEVVALLQPYAPQKSNLLQASR